MALSMAAPRAVVLEESRAEVSSFLRRPCWWSQSAEESGTGIVGTRDEVDR